MFHIFSGFAALESSMEQPEIWNRNIFWKRAISCGNQEQPAKIIEVMLGDFPMPLVTSCLPFSVKLVRMKIFTIFTIFTPPNWDSEAWKFHGSSPQVLSSLPECIYRPVRVRVRVRVRVLESVRRFFWMIPLKILMWCVPAMASFPVYGIGSKPL